MTIQELRIGNWINCKTKDGLQTGRIDNLLEVSNTIYFISAKAGKIDYQGKVTSENDCFEPIPITEEILLKCGFEKKEETAYDKYEINPHDGRVIEVAIYTSGIDVFVRYICGGCHLRSIKYLHELQNLVSVITKKELEIEL